MAAVHGQLQAFDSNEEDWQSYVERIEQYFAANKITDGDQKRAMLLAFCGAKTYRMIKSVLAPAKPAESSFENVVELVGKHCNPPPAATVQRCLFNARNRKKGVAKFVTELKQLAEYCDFGDNLDEMFETA